MANLKEIRNRVTSIRSTMQITSAMKMVSAAKLKKAQDVITVMQPYSSELKRLFQNLSTSLEDDFTGIYSSREQVKKVLLVVITSNRGLCGGFNSSIIKKTIKTINKNYKNIPVDLLTIGKKGSDVLSKKCTVIEKNNAIFDDLTFDNVSKIAQNLMSLYADGSYDKIDIIYNHFKNTTTQIGTIEQFLPIKEPIKNKKNINLDYILEPSKQQIIIKLIPKLLKTKLYQAIIDSFASEHGARMTAMHKATDNAIELRDELLLTYNKARQAAITNEILEIVGGAEALNN